MGDTPVTGAGQRIAPTWGFLEDRTDQCARAHGGGGGGLLLFGSVQARENNLCKKSASKKTQKAKPGNSYPNPLQAREGKKKQEKR